MGLGIGFIGLVKRGDLLKKLALYAKIVAAFAAFKKDTLERQGEFTLSFLVPYPLQGAGAGQRV